MNKLYQNISVIAKRLGAEKIVLFGSRARGDNRERSDIDLAVYGLPESSQSQFRAEIDELPTLLDFDIVFVSPQTDPALLKNIEKDGKILMSKKEEKYKKLVSAVARLEEAIEDYGRTSLSSVRDGAIQRFEFCTELAWKTMREYLTEQGYTDINSPKSVMKTAFADGLIKNEQGWLDILSSRNITSHVYDDAEAEKIFGNITAVYVKLFKDLIDKLK